MLAAFLFSLIIGCSGDSSPETTPNTASSANKASAQKDKGSKPQVDPKARPNEQNSEESNKADESTTQLNATYGKGDKLIRRDQSGKCYVENKVSGNRFNKRPVECAGIMADPAWSQCIDGQIKKGEPSGKCICHYKAFKKEPTPVRCPKPVAAKKEDASVSASSSSAPSGVDGATKAAPVGAVKLPSKTVAPAPKAASPLPARPASKAVPSAKPAAVSPTSK